MPSFAWALQKIRGYLYPFGIFYLLYSKFFNKKINLYLIGIHPDYQKEVLQQLYLTHLFKH